MKASRSNNVNLALSGGDAKKMLNLANTVLATLDTDMASQEVLDMALDLKTQLEGLINNDVQPSS